MVGTWYISNHFQYFYYFFAIYGNMSGFEDINNIVKITGGHLEYLKANNSAKTYSIVLKFGVWFVIIIHSIFASLTCVQICLVLKVFTHNDYFDWYFNNVKGDNSVNICSIILQFIINVRLELSNLFASLTYIEIQTVMEIVSI